MYNLHGLRDMAMLARTHKLIIGVDRTFNLSNVFVTCLTYKHPLLRRDVLDRNRDYIHPTILGPVYLHFDTDYR